MCEACKEAEHKAFVRIAESLGFELSATVVDGEYVYGVVNHDGVRDPSRVLDESRGR